MNSKIQYWLDLAEYDIETSKAMLQTGRYLYVGFMCHQTIEKALKAIISKNDILPPKIHGLMKLAQIADIYELMNESQKDLLDILDPLNIAARYPEQRDKLVATLTQDRCKAILEETEELLCWIKKQL